MIGFRCELSGRFFVVYTTEYKAAGNFDGARQVIDRSKTDKFVSVKQIIAQQTMHGSEVAILRMITDFSTIRVYEKSAYGNAENTLWVCCQRFVDKWPGQGEVFSLQVLRCIAYGCG